MLTDVTHVTILVADTDEAKDWDTTKLGCELRMDQEFASGMRWVTVAPSGSDTEIMLQEPNPEFHGEEQAAAMRSRIGAGTTTVLATDDCRGTVAELTSRGVSITTEPEEVPWGIHANMEDLYGNPYNIVENH